MNNARNIQKDEAAYALRKHLDLIARISKEKDELKKQNRIMRKALNDIVRLDRVNPENLDSISVLDRIIRTCKEVLAKTEGGTP